MKYCIYCGYALKGGETTCPECKRALPVTMRKAEAESSKAESSKIEPESEPSKIEPEPEPPKIEPESETSKIEPEPEPPKSEPELSKVEPELSEREAKGGKTEEPATSEKERIKIELPDIEVKEKNGKSKTLIFILVVVICVAVAAVAILAGKKHRASKVDGQPVSSQDTRLQEQPDKEQPDKEQPDKEQPAKEQLDEELPDADLTDIALKAFCQVNCDIAAAIHEYEFIVADCTWVDAKQDCLDRGGYLVNIDSREEYDYILSKIQEQNLQDKVFYLGGGRSIDSNVYYWIDKNNQFSGDALNGNPSAWCSGNWMANEPSYQDGDTMENIMTMFFYKGENRWVWNDAPNDITPYYSGKIGYICEYEE